MTLARSKGVRRPHFWSTFTNTRIENSVRAIMRDIRDGIREDVPEMLSIGRKDRI